MTELPNLSASGGAIAPPDADNSLVLRIVHGGEPSVEELAALVAVFARPAAPPPPLALRRPLLAWVASGLVKGTRTKV